MATFDGVTFSERGTANGALLPMHGFKMNTAILAIPGGNTVIVQCLGYAAVPLDIPARVTAAQLASLRGKVSTTGALVYVGGTITCTLTDVEGAQEIRQPNDVYFVTLKFLTEWYQ